MCLLPVPRSLLPPRHVFVPKTNVMITSSDPPPASALDQLTPAVRRFLSGSKQLLINGEWMDAASGKTFSVYDPATGETIAQVAEGEAEDIDHAVAAARHSFNKGSWRNLTPSDRGKILWHIGDMI